MWGMVLIERRFARLNHCSGEAKERRLSMDMNRSSEKSGDRPGDAMASTVRNVGEAAVSAAERVGQSLDQGRAALNELQTAIAEKTRECMETTDVYVRNNPWQAVGIAAGVGMVLGLLMSRR
jgi:ElaB/YqjD/DUF883 family membrane-anchored ribosome-binding protein